jgi:hypothetical protein
MIKIAIYISPLGLYTGRPRLQATEEAQPSALKREHPVLQNMKFFPYFCGSFLPSWIPNPDLDTDPESDRIGIRIQIH